MKISEPGKKIHPKDKAGILSFMTLWYIVGILRKAVKRDIHEEDLYEVPNALNSGKRGDSLEKILKQYDGYPYKVQFLKALWVNFSYDYFLICVPYVAIKVIRSIYEPELVSKYISYFKEGQTELGFNDVVYYCSAMMILLILYSITIILFHCLGSEFSLRVRTAVSTIIYRKSLRLSHESLEKFTVGHVVTLMTKDMAIVEKFFKWIQDLVITTIQAGAVCVMLYIKMGPISLVGILFLALIVTIEGLIGKYITKIRLIIDFTTDERIKTVKQALESIRVIKMFTWEPFFVNKISSIRRKEVTNMVKDAFAKSLIVVLGLITPDCMIFILIISCLFVNYPLDTELIFYIINCIRILRILIVFVFPVCMGTLADFRGCMQRITRFLESPEKMDCLDQYSDEPKIVLKDVSVLKGDKPILSNISLRLKEGITTIVGCVGSGKSTFLLTVMKEVQFTGNIVSYGRFSYCGQSPWLFPGTIKENIVFEERFNVERYNKVVKICDLDKDFIYFKEGDQTVIVNDGANLSKGQRCRINLARAIYRDSEIYLIDDCLSALDNNVQLHIVKELLKNFFQYKICLVVTQNKNLVEHSNNTIILENSTVTYYGTPDEKVDLFLTEMQTSCDLDNEFYINGSKESSLEDVPFLDHQQNIYHEYQKDGGVEPLVYWKYLKFGRGVLMMIFIISMFVCSQVTESFSTKTLAKWVDSEQSKLMSKNTTKYSQLEEKSTDNLLMYSGLLLLSIVLTLIKVYLFLDFTRVASIKINKELTSKVLSSNMKFMDTHLLGSILNRFSQDLNNIDEQLPMGLIDMFRIAGIFCGVCLVMLLVQWKLVFPILVLFVCVLILRGCCMPGARSLKRLETSSRSPFVGHINATLEGLLYIRAFNNEKDQLQKFENYHNTYMSAYFTQIMAIITFMLYMDIICLTIVFIIMWSLILYFTGISAGNVGIAIIQLFSLRNHLSIFLKYTTEMQILMTSVERVIEYTDEPQENIKGASPKDWPIHGLIQIENVSLSYDNVVQVLNNINLKIAPRQKVGIVGRTGCGKSSLVSLLLRLYDYHGKILIDGRDIQTLSLEYLRNNIDIIPQDSMIFNDTIRNNFDPLSLYTDDEIWNVINKLEIKHLVGNLYETIESNKFSSGEKQLISLGRAMLRKNKILILDEATANVDVQTEQKMLCILNEWFKDCTVINIVHKLGSLKGYDKIYCMKNGELQAFCE